MQKITCLLALGVLASFVQPGASLASDCVEGYLFATGDEIIRLPEMVAIGSYGTFLTKSGKSWILKNGSIDVSSKSRSVDINTETGTSTIPAQGKGTVSHYDGSIADPDVSKKSDDSKSQQMQVRITHHDIATKAKRNKPVHIILRENSFFSMVAPYRVRWQNGTALFNAPSGIIIDTNEGIVQAPPGSVFALSSSFGGIRLLNCSTLCPVNFVLPEKQLVVTASEELFICNHRPMKFEVTPEDGIGRKSIKLSDLGNNLTAVSCQFSIPTLMRSQKYFKDWTHNGGSQTTLSSDLLKTAAVVSFARKSPQQFYIAPRSNTF